MPAGDDIKTRFGQRLRELRQAKGLSQEELAFRAGLHRTYVSSTERGQRNVALVNIEKLATALEVEMAGLFRGMEKGR
ncbi:MAG: helix-turn-helix transcriptional regulator [Dehalococcoidia bacterium]|nr:helix-turn-helix transcriptional regulator [Dehalococcoidia bacterium]